MNKDFKFEDIGKKTPYRTPENMFRDMQDNVLRRVGEDDRRRRRLRIAVISVVAAAAIVVGLIFIPAGNTSKLTSEQPLACNTVKPESTAVKSQPAVTAPSPKTVQKSEHATAAVEKTRHRAAATTVNTAEKDEDWVSQLSDEDLNSLMALSENDEFLN